MKKLVLLGIASFCATIYGQDACPFCHEAVIERQKIDANDCVIALLSYKPITEGHILIIPKRHCEFYEELTEDEILAIHRMIRRVHNVAKEYFQVDSYLLLQKNGKNVGQSVPHVHFHYIPRKKEETFLLGFMFRFYMQLWKKPLSNEEMNQMALPIRILMESLGEPI